MVFEGEGETSYTRLIEGARGRVEPSFVFGSRNLFCVNSNPSRFVGIQAKNSLLYVLLHEVRMRARRNLPPSARHALPRASTTATR